MDDFALKLMLLGHGNLAIVHMQEVCAWNYRLSNVVKHLRLVIYTPEEAGSFKGNLCKGGNMNKADVVGKKAHNEARMR